MSVPPHISQSDGYRFIRDLFILLGIGLLAWPFVSFVAIFIFDAPMHGVFDEVKRYALAGSVWGYPAFWGVGWVLFRGAAKDGRKGTRLAWPLALPLAPLLFLVAAFAFGG